MRVSRHTRFGAVLAVWVLVVSSATARSYTVEILPPLATSAGELREIVALDLNNRGQVVGIARPDLESGNEIHAAFRFTPGRGMESLDPEGGATSTARRINHRGDVFGADFSRPTQLGRPFLFSDAGGFDRMEKGANRDLRRCFHLSDVNRHGDVVGNTLTAGGCRVRPYLRRRGRKWVDLRSVRPELAGATARLINDRRQIVFTRSRPYDPASEVQPNTAWVLRGGRLIDLGHLGGRVNWPVAIDNRGRIAGTSMDEHGRHRAYLWSRSRGLVSLHPAGFELSFVVAMASDGSVGGWLSRKDGAGNLDGLFLYSADGKGPRVVAGPRELRRFGRDCGLKSFDCTAVNGVNRHGEFVGFVVDQGRQRFLPFVLDDTGRFHDLQAVLDLAQVDFEILNVLEINDLGTILVAGLAGGRGGRETAALLTPVGR